MRKDQSFLERMAQRADLPEEPLPMQPIVEIAGDTRVLVENHRGVYEYTPERVGVHVRFGRLQVCGCNLHLTHMSKVRLIICGRIQGVTILRREQD